MITTKIYTKIQIISCKEIENEQKSNYYIFEVLLKDLNSENKFVLAKHFCKDELDRDEFIQLDNKVCSVNLVIAGVTYEKDKTIKRFNDIKITNITLA